MTERTTAPTSQPPDPHAACTEHVAAGATPNPRRAHYRHHSPEPDDARHWAGPERRVTGPVTLRELEDHIDRRISARLEAHAAAEKRDRDELLAEIRGVRQLLLSAFPEGDPDGHRRSHEESIETMRDLRELMRNVRNNTITGLVWGAVVLVGMALWTYVQAKLGVGR